MAKPKLEKDIQLAIKKTLPLFCRPVIYVDRLNSGNIDLGHRRILLCKKGTPDLFALVKHGCGHFLFIEVKRPGGKQSPDQKKFQKMIEDFDNIHYCLATSVTDVINFINKYILTDKQD